MTFQIESDGLEVYSLLFIFGAAIGSFLNVVILRYPEGESIVKPRSTCPSCGTLIPWYHNIPLFSYLFLRGKCAVCHERISFQYFIVELMSAVLTVILFIKLQWSIDFILMGLLFYSLIVLAFIDFKYKAVPDTLLLFSFVLGFIASYGNLLEAFKHAFLFAGALVLLDFLVTFYIQNIKAKLLNDERLRSQRALGEGDIPIIAIIGALLGVKAGLIAIFLAALFAIIPALYNNIRKKDIETPFIPYLLFGLMVEYIFEISKVF